MNNSVLRTMPPEDDELEKKLAELASIESELVQKELELATLQAKLQAFELRYLRVVGTGFAKLDDIKAQIAEVFLKLHGNDADAIKEAKQSRAQADESAQADRIAKEQPEFLGEFKPSDSLKSLYREAAKRFHPDFATGEDDHKRRAELMVKVNAAYKIGDEAGLQRMIKEGRDSPENVSGEDVGAKLVRIIRRLAQTQRRLSDAQSEIDSLMESDICLLWFRVQEIESQNRNLLDEMAEQLNLQITEQQENLDKLLAAFVNLQADQGR
jgi:hypothetical protein